MQAVNMMSTSFSPIKVKYYIHKSDENIYDIKLTIHFQHHMFWGKNLHTLLKNYKSNSGLSRSLDSFVKEYFLRNSF